MLPPTANNMSLAELKLDRQRQRNEAADPTLPPVPHPLEKRQTSRTKGKWKPFDYASDAGGGVPVDTRVNTYSRTSSHSRPVSALSHRTDESTFSENSGFQLFTARKGRRHPFELRQYGSEKQQTIVEAPFDKREIYEVFGNALPAPEYLEQNVGYKNGQVQFLQHPNGDVSAQQWSASRYEWVNLGQFSNIRKRVEGQLGSDRLKGEMAHHTLQQNTLQYFRTVAKQREAMVMGLPFGPKDVEAALPIATISSSGNTDSGSHRETQPTPQQYYSTADIKSQNATRTELTATTAPPVASTPRSPLPPNVPREPMAQRWEISGATGGAQAYDPFYMSSASQPASYSDSQYSNRNNYPATAQYTYHSVAQTPYRMAQSYQFPPVAVPSQTMQSPGAQKYFAERAAFADKMQTQWRQVYGHQPPVASYGRPGYPYRSAGPDEQHATQETRPCGSVNDREIVAPQPKSVSSVDRSAMRNTLYKLGETAKERNLSQANIRTVLHDPFQSPSAPGQMEPKTMPATTKATGSPLLTRQATGKHNAQSSPVPSAHRKDILQQSSPDTHWTKRPYEHSTPLLAKSSASIAISQAIIGTGLELPLNKLDTKDVKKSYEEHLNDWWTNGSTFARQEDLYQAIIAAEAADDKLNSPPAHLTPIGPPSRSVDTSKASFNETTTRLLIPVCENLASYVDGPAGKRRDYWCPWGPAPEWCIDRSAEGNKSFFDKDWGSPPQRVGRDPRYNGSGFESSAGGSVGGSSRWQGVEQRFACAGKF